MKHKRPRSSATTPPLSVFGCCTQETLLPHLKVPTSGGLSTQIAPPRSPLSPRECTTSEAAPGPKPSTHGASSALRLHHRQLSALAHRKPTCLTSKYLPVGHLDSKCPLGFLSRLVSTPPEKPQLARNEAHPTLQQHKTCVFVGWRHTTAKPVVKRVDFISAPPPRS